MPEKLLLVFRSNESLGAPENIKEPHNSYPYPPPHIVHVLYQTSHLESRGSGAKLIMDACKAHDVPEPEWRNQGGFVVVTFRRQAVPVQQNNGDTVNGTINVTENVTSLATRFKVTERTIKRDLKAFQTFGAIKHDGPSHSGRWFLFQN